MEYSRFSSFIMSDFKHICVVLQNLFLTLLALGSMLISHTYKPGYCPLQFALNEGRPVAVSIPATEHSVMTAWGSERQAIENMINHFGGGLFACVMDSYDYAAVRR